MDAVTIFTVAAVLVISVVNAWIWFTIGRGRQHDNTQNAVREAYENWHGSRLRLYGQGDWILYLRCLSRGYIRIDDDPREDIRQQLQQVGLVRRRGGTVSLTKLGRRVVELTRIENDSLLPEPEDDDYGDEVDYDYEVSVDHDCEDEPLSDAEKAYNQSIRAKEKTDGTQELGV